MPVFYVEFDLRNRSPLTVENGDVIVDKGHQRITVRNIEADSHDDAIQKARPRAKAFLDDLHFRHRIALETGTGLGVGLQDSPEFRHSGYDAKLKVKGGHRKRVPRVLKEVQMKPSDAKTYYRKAAISEDPFDKFRNLYLAIENVASKIIATKCKRTYKELDLKELDLLKIALQECFSSNKQLLEKYSHVYGFENTGDIFLDVASFLYKKNRVQLSHSKASENKKIPFNPADEWQVEVSLTLADFVAKSLLSYEDTYLLL